MPISNRSFVRFTVIFLIVGLLALVCVVGTTIWLAERAQFLFGEVIQARDARGSAVELRNAVLTAESSQRGFIVTGNEIYLAPYGLADGSRQRQLEMLKRLLAANKETELPLQRLTDLIAEKFAEMDQSIALKRDRREAEALAIFRSNRGKALMDEANVFFSGLIRAAEDRLTASASEQNANATLLRWVSILGGIVIIIVAGGSTIIVFRYTRELAAARDQVEALNAGLEQRVRDRTADLAATNAELVKARDRAEVLLTEVNHRVANSLALAASLVSLQRNAVRDQVAKDALAETRARIYAVSLVHKRLYSSGEVGFVELDEYLSSLLDHLATSMQDESHGSSLKYELDPVRLRTDASVNLGVVVTEWVTNAFKYAYPDRAGEVRVRLKHLPAGRVELSVEDDGVGRNSDEPVKGTGLGTRIVKAMAVSMSAEIEYLRREPGTAARLLFSLQAA